MRCIAWCGGDGTQRTQRQLGTSSSREVAQVGEYNFREIKEARSILVEVRMGCSFVALALTTIYSDFPERLTSFDLACFKSCSILFHYQVVGLFVISATCNSDKLVRVHGNC